VKRHSNELTIFTNYNEKGGKMRKVTVPFLKTLVIVFGVLLLATNVALAQVSVSLPHMVARAGTTKNINVTVGVLPIELSVISYQFNLAYDPSVLRITGYTTAGTISGKATMPPIVELTSGWVRVAGASDSALSGPGTLISFTAEMLAPGTSPLTLSGFTFNEGIPSAVIIPAPQGQVVVPSLTVNLPEAGNIEVVQDSTWNIPITADAITGKGILSYQFTVLYDSNMISITEVSVAGTSSAPIGGNIISTAVAGRITVAASSTDVLTGATGATLLNLRAKVKPAANGTLTLTFLDFLFNEGDPAVGAIDGSVHVRDVTGINVIDRVPTQYVLDQNYPNPFNPTTMITFGLPNQTNVTLEVYNILGMKVRTLIDGERMNAAKYSVEWDGKDNSGMAVPSGVYLYRIHTDKFSAAKKMVLMK
jgi:hypothetical protein